jgi:hypothetical protein
MDFMDRMKRLEQRMHILSNDEIDREYKLILKEEQEWYNALPHAVRKDFKIEET